MNDTIWIAIIVSIPPTIVAIATFIIGLRNSGKLKEIHTLTNSNLQKVTSSLDVANTKIDGLNTLVTAITKVKSKERK